MKPHRAALAAAIAAAAIAAGTLAPGAQAGQDHEKCPPGTHDPRYCEHDHHHHHHHHHWWDFRALDALRE